MGHLSFFSALVCSFLLTRTRICGFQATPAIPSTRTRTTRTPASTSKLFSVQTYKVDVSENAARNYNSFIEWANYYGIVQENFQLNPKSDNWGAVAAVAAPAGSRVLLVPAVMRLWSQTLRQEFAAVEPMVNQYIDPTTSNGDIDLRNHFYLFLKVLQEYDLGDQSPYFSWLDALPRKFSTAINFDDFEVGCLPPFVKFLARRDRHNYDTFVNLLQGIDTPTISPATKSNTEITKWAFNVVFTRARASFGEAEIIPMSDMLNHCANPNVDIQFDDEGNVHVVLFRDVQPGDPLTKCYGQPTNPSRFLATYGFFDPSPPSTYCKLLPGLVVTQELKNLGFEYDRMVFYVENGDIAQEVWDVMLYTVLENIDPAVQQQFYDAHMRGDFETKQQLHQYYSAQTCNGLLQHVNEMLDEVAECQDEMDQGGMGVAHANLPMIRRHNDFVRQTFTKVKRNLERM